MSFSLNHSEERCKYKKVNLKAYKFLMQRVERLSGVLQQTKKTSCSFTLKPPDEVY